MAASDSKRGCRLCGKPRAGNSYFNTPGHGFNSESFLCYRMTGYAYHGWDAPEILKMFCVPHIEKFLSWYRRRLRASGIFDPPTEENVSEWISVLVFSGSKRLNDNGFVAFCQQKNCQRWATGQFDGVYLCAIHKKVKDRGNLLITAENNRQPIMDAVKAITG